MKNKRVAVAVGSILLVGGAIAVLLVTEPFSDGQEPRASDAADRSHWAKPVYNRPFRTYEMTCTSGDTGKKFKIPHYSLGAKFSDRLPRTSSKRICSDEIPESDKKFHPPLQHFYEDIYGDCKPEDETGCNLPLTVQTSPACQRNATDINDAGPLKELRIGDRRAVLFEGMLEVYTKEATITIFAQDEDLLLRAAKRLKRLPDVGEVEISCNAPAKTLKPRARARQG